jgi:predicted SprT family Zn-dependent metalloprotease
MHRHGLHNWTFAFDRSRRRFGACIVKRRRLQLSAYLTHLNTLDEVRDTILHEIAHALEPDDGHGARWKARCVAIGARPVRCYTEDQVVSPPRREAPYQIGCKSCDWWGDRRKVTRRKLLCRRCSSMVTYRHKPSGTEFVVEQRFGVWQTRITHDPSRAASPALQSGEPSVR